MIDCQKCQETSCAKQVSKQKLTVLTCTAYKARKTYMTDEKPKEDKLFDSIERLSKIAQDLVRRKTELSQTEQKPVAWVWVNNKGLLTYGETPHDMFKSSPLYTHPPQRKWVGLTVEDVRDCLKGLPTQSIEVYARSVEAKLKQKNGYAEEKNT